MKAYQSIRFKDFQIISNRWYTVSELAKGLRTSKKVIRKHIHLEHFKAGQISQEYLVEGASIIEFLNRSRGEEPEKPKVLPRVLSVCTTHEIVNIANCDSNLYVFQKGSVS